MYNGLPYSITGALNGKSTPRFAVNTNKLTQLQTGDMSVLLKFFLLKGPLLKLKYIQFQQRNTNIPWQYSLGEVTCN